MPTSALGCRYCRVKDVLGCESVLEFQRAHGSGLGNFPSHAKMYFRPGRTSPIRKDTRGKKRRQTSLSRFETKDRCFVGVWEEFHRLGEGKLDRCLAAGGASLDHPVPRSTQRTRDTHALLCRALCRSSGLMHAILHHRNVDQSPQSSMGISAIGLGFNILDTRSQPSRQDHRGPRYLFSCCSGPG